MNKVYKIVWNKKINQWVVASELAKGLQNASTSVARVDDNPFTFFKKGFICMALLSVFSGVNAQSITVNTAAEFKTAVEGGAYDHITLGNNITLGSYIAVNFSQKNNIVIDGNHQYELKVTSGGSNGLSINKGGGTLTLQNMSIDTANYYSMVRVDSTDPDINVVYDNIKNFSASQHTFMRGGGGNSNAIATMGNMGVVAPVTRQEIGEINKMIFTGQYHVVHSNPIFVSFQNSSAVINTATMDFKKGADVKIDRTGTTANITNTDNRAFMYTFEDGAKFELIAAQNILLGTNTNRGFSIGTYDDKGFGAGASIILNQTNTGAAYANGIDNATTNTTGINHNATGTDHVVFNLGDETDLRVTGTGISASKTTGSGGIYVRNAGKIDADIGMHIEHNNGENGEVVLANQGTITSQTAGIELLSTANKTMKLDGTSGSLTALSGAGIKVGHAPENGDLNLALVGGEINVSEGATGIEFNGNTANVHTITGTTINANGTTSTAIEHNNANAHITFKDTHINIEDGIGFSDLNNKTFAKGDTDGTNQLTVKGKGTALRLAKDLSQLAGAHLNINVTDHTGVVGTTGAGVGVEITGGTVTDVIKVEDGVNINATGATALKILGTVERELVNQGVITGYIRFDNGDVNNTITNTGTIDNLITHGGDDTLTIESGASLLGVANLGEGQNKVYINNPSQIHGVMTGSGDDLFELSNIDSNHHAVIINQLDAGAGTNTLNVKDSIFKAQADTKFENFANIHLDKTALTLVASNNIATGTVHIDQLSALTLGDQYTGDFSASVVGDGTVTIDKGATVTLTGINTELTGNLTVAAGGTLNTNHLNQFGSGTTEVAGTLNHTANSLQTHLTGAGQLNLTGDQSAFNFDANVGSDFTGNVRLQNNTFNLSGTNTDTLANSTLSLSSGNTTTVEEQNQAVKNLELDGATLVFKDAGSIVTDHLSNTTKNSVIQVDVTDTESVNVIDQNSGVGKQLITANTSAINLDHLSLQYFTGQVLGAGTELEIKQNGHAVAEGTYHYTLKEHHGLALNYGLSKIDIHEDEILELNSTTSTSRVMNAQLTGLGGINLTSTAAGLTIDNALNDYQGATNVTAGMVTLGSDHALGQTAHLNLATGTTVDLGGHKQTIGGLTNAGSLDIAGGSLTLTGNGTSSAKDGLHGAGQLNIAGGDLSVSAENTNLSANVSIASGSALTLIKNATVGSGHIAIAGALKLQAMDTALSNTMSGAGSINVSDHSDVRLTADNTGFTGTFAIDGTSHLTATDFNQLGSGKVTIAESGIVNLNKVTGELTNIISGDGNLNLSGSNLSLNAANTHLKDLTGILNIATGSNLTLAENGQLNDAAKVNVAAVGDSITVNSIGDFSFNNYLTGSGLLDVQTAGNGFNFGKDVGSNFAGTVNLSNSTFKLSSDNTAALKNATLVIGKGNTTTVDTANQAIGNLTLQGGKTVFKGKSSIITNTLASNGKSIIQVDLDAIAPTDGTAANLFDQNSGQHQQLIMANHNDGLKLSDLTLQGLNGSAVGKGTIRNIDQNDQKVAEGTYNYTLNKTDGLGINYGLSALNIVDGQTLTLDATSAANKNMTATLTGTGSLTLTSDDQGLTLTNDKNAYTGATNVTAGLVTAGSDNAFGQTSQLNLAAGTTVDLNGKTQTVGSLTNKGKVNLAGGTLTITNEGGASTSSGELIGAGDLMIAAGDFNITTANKDLAAGLGIHSGASVSLSNAGTLGTSKVAVDGALNLNANSTLANQLKGTGSVNTHADIALTGDNSGFTGAQNIGNQASLTVSNQSALGLGQVNFGSETSTLNLNGVASAVQNALNGAGIVNIANGSAVNFSSDNKDFEGIFAVDGTSALTATAFSQLGKGSVSVVQGGHINLDKMTGELTNAISGAGSVNLSGTDLSLNAGNTHFKDLTGTLNLATGSNLTLAENGQLNDAAKVNIAAIGDSVTVNSNGDFSFNNNLVGSGLLNVQTAGNSFDFGKDVGSDFAGTVNLTNSTLSLSGDNTAALKNATLVIGKGNTTIVDTKDQTIGNLTLDGSQAVFKGKGSIATDTLASNGSSIIQVDLDAIAPTDGTAANLFDQNSGQNHQLITSTNNDGLKLSDLTLQGLNGNAVGEGTIRNIDQNDQKVAEGTYNYALNKTDGLGISYGLSALNIVDGQTLTLDATGATNKNMTATLTGTGNLTLTSDDQWVTLTNDKNAYTGATNVTAGLVKAGSDNAFGQTSQLNLAAGTTVDLNGKTQVVGSLKNEGKFDLAAGALTITNEGGASTSSGELIGAGDLMIAAGDFNITTANKDLAAGIGIYAGASVSLSNAGTLGTSQISIDGVLNLNDDATFGNTLSGSGVVNTNADIALTGDNSGFTGAQNIGDKASLTVSNQSALGSGQVNFETTDSKLNLNGVTSAVQNVLHGSGIVNITASAAVNFSADNKDFSGTFAVDGTSQLTTTYFSQLGKGSVSVAQGGAVNLNKITGELTNAISGDGNLNLSGTNLSLNSGNIHLKDLTGAINITKNSNLTLAENSQLNDAAKVNITTVGDSVTVNSTGDFSFNNHLTGSGLLDVQTAGNGFNFGKDVGSDFAGTVNLTNSTLSLGGDNTATLKNATLVIGQGNTTTVDTANQAIGNLTLQGGKTVFKGKGSLITNMLASDGTSIIQVDLDAIAPADGTAANLFDQNSGQNHQLITANNNDGLQLSDLTLQGLNGSAVGEGTIRNIDQNDQKVAEGTYNYALNKTDGLGISYGLSALNIVDGQTLTLDATSAANKNMTATLTGTGNLTLTSDDQGLTLTNDKNAYTGATTITAGLVTAGSDNAFGKTSQLKLATGTTIDLNGKTQTVGSLKNEGKFDLAAGALTITNADGAASTSSGELTGTGNLTISAGDLNITSVNNDLAASIGIHSGASVSLSETGTLGTSQIAIDGVLNLNDDATFGNTLSGSGVVNTNADIALTGDNSGFTGAQNIGDLASLTVNNQAALGSGQVNFVTTDSKLKLTGVTSAVQNVLHGSGIVNIANGSAVNFSNDNKDFAGTFAVDGTSQLTTTDFSQLGKSKVNLASDSHVNLNKITGELTNAISGAGSVNLSGTDLSLNAGNTHLKDLTGTLNIATGSNLTLAENGQLNDAAKVNVASKGDSITVNSTGNFSFNNNLVGSGLLDVQTAGNGFNFGKNVGSDFAGTVNVANSTFHLISDNTAALKNATLVVGKGNTTTVDTENQTIGSLMLQGGQTVFRDKGSIITDTLASNGTSIIQVDLDAIAPTDGATANLFDQNHGQNHQLITANNNDGLKLSDLTLQGLNGNAVGESTIRNVDQNGQKVAEGTYNYALNKTNGLGISYGLSALNIVDGQTLTLDSTSAANKNMTATLTGTGNLTLTSDDQGLTLTNDKNAYTGATNVTVGLVKAGSDNAFGQTSMLNLATGTTVDLNGKTQTVGSLKNEGAFDLAAGSLTITNAGGAASTSSGELLGAGDLTITSGELKITYTNNDLAANIDIHSGASVSLSHASTLGSSTVAIDGALNLRADTIFDNTLTGSGAVNTQANGTLNGDNSGFSGAQNIGNQASLTVRNQSALGLGQVNFATTDSKLNLNGVASAVQNVLHGSGIVNITDNATVNFSADNKDFTGTFAVDCTSQLTTTDFSQLGKGSVSVVQGGAVNLDKITGELANSISGAGSVNLSGTDLSLNAGNTHLKDLTGAINLATGSNLTLVENGQLNDAAKVNVASKGDSITVNSTGDFSFNNHLTGLGLLDVKMAGNSFNFGKDVGSDFAGTVNLENTQFNLSGDNAQALQNANLSLGSSNVTTVGAGTQTIGGLTLNGGHLSFNSDKETINTGTLSSTGANTTVTINTEYIPRVDVNESPNLFDQLTGLVTNIITAKDSSGLNVNDLTLKDQHGKEILDNVHHDIVLNGEKIADSTYNYHLVENKGLGVTYGLVAIDILDGKTLTLDSTTINRGNNQMTAKITGQGNLTLTSDDQGMIVDNSHNAYTGATNVTAGLVTAGSDNAFGKTSQLKLAIGTTVDLNGKTQAVGSLKNAGNLDIAAGALTITNAGGGASTSSGSLVGAGNLTISAGDLSITSANNDLAARIGIHSGASVSLSETGTLGSSTVAIDGALNLRADTVLNNTLIGKGAVNTQANVTLSGDNLSFTGAQNIGNQASLTVSNQAALGSGQVNFVTTDSKLKLTGVTSAVQNVLHGSGIVNIANGSAVNFSNDNKDFTGIFAVDGTSHLTTTDFNQLGSGKVTIAESGAVNLNKITGELTNTISGDGSLNLSGTDLLLNAANTHLKDLTGTLNIATGSNLTLAENGQLNDAAKVNITTIGDSVTVNSTGNFSFNNHLTGSGSLDIKTAGNSFNFGKDVGSDFAGTVNLENTQFNLSGDNAQALQNANLSLGAGNITTVGTGTQTIGGLTLNGGHLLFNSDKETINTGTLSSTGANTTVTINTEYIPRVDVNESPNLFDQLTGLVTNIITANDSSGLNVNDLTLKDQHGKELLDNVHHDIVLNSEKIADSTYNYHLVENKGLGVTYGLVALDILDGKTLTLDSTTISRGNNKMTAKITGQGNLTLMSDDQGMIIDNSHNAYTGATNVIAGLVKAGSGNAFGQTSQLNLAAGTTVDLNGQQQSIGRLTNAGTLNLAGGSLTMTEKGSTSSGELMGAGDLIISGGDLNITTANTDLMANVAIHSGAAIQLSETGSLGNGAIDVGGTLDINNGHANFKNALSGSGKININDNVALTADANTFSGTLSVNDQTLSVTSEKQLGTAKIVNHGTVDLNLLADGRWVNQMTGTGDFIKSGNGTLRVASQLLHTGNTEIKAGTVFLEKGAVLGGTNQKSRASMAGTLNIAQGSTLAGTGTVNQIVNNYGTIDVNLRDVRQSPDRDYAQGNATLTVNHDVNNHNKIYIGNANTTAGNRLIINGNYTAGDNAVLYMNTDLGNQTTSLSDQLIVSGNISGKTKLYVTDIGNVAGGMTSPLGIKIIDAGSSDDNAFELQNTVVKGINEYVLSRNAEDQDWYLTSYRDLYRPDVGSTMANSMGTIRSQLPGYGSHISGALAAGSGGLRALDRNMTVDGQYLGSVWFNETGTHDKGNIAGDQIHYTYKGFASVLGADTGFRTGDGLVIIGGMISTSSMDSKGWNRITESRSTGSISGQSIGLYGSWFKNADDALSPFIDYTISYGKYDNTVTTLNNASSSYDSRLWTVSVQGGYPMAIGENLVVEPQAQISYIDYKVDNYRDFNGTDIREQQKGHVISRVGAYVYPKTGDVKPYAAFNLWYDDIASKVSYDDRSLSSGKPGLFYEAKLGVQAKMSENFTINSEINYRQGKHKHKNYNFNIGFKYQF